MEGAFHEWIPSEEGAENVRTRSTVLIGTLLFTFVATVASAERGGKHNGSSAAQFLSGPACAVPEQDSSNHMAFVRGRTRSGLIGGSYGEIFFASGASTRAAANRHDGANADAGGSTAATLPSGGSTSGGAAGTGSTGSGGTSATGNSGATSSSGGAATVSQSSGNLANGTSTTSAATGASDNGTSAAGDGPTVVNMGNGKYVVLPAPVHTTPAAVNPEPSTWVLLGTALCALFFVRSRQVQHNG